MRKIISFALWSLIVCTLLAQETYVKVYDFPVVPVIGYNVQGYNGRIYTIASLFCDLGGNFVECSFLAELNTTGDTLWATMIPDIDVASGTMVIINDTITVTGNNELLTAWRMAHFDLNGHKLGETIVIEHPQRKFTNMFQLTTQYFNGKYAICGSAWEGDTIWSLIYMVDKQGELDTLISLEGSDRISALWDNYIDSEGRLTTYHWIEYDRPPGPGPPRINYRKIFKFDASYDTVWTYRSENSEYNDVIPYGCELHDGRTILSYTNPQQIENIHSVRAINEDGSKDWQHNYTISGYRKRNIYRLKTLVNGDIMGSGSYRETGGDPRISDSPWLFRMSPEGVLLWERVYYDFDSTLAPNGSSRIGSLYDFIELQDGSILGVGNLRYDLKSRMLVMRVDSNGCLDPDNCNEIVYITGHLTTGIESSIESNSQFVIRPNPTSEYIIVEWSDAAEGQQIFIIDNTGRHRQTGMFTAGRSSIDVSALSPGMYFITTDGKSRIMGKFVITE